MAGYDVTLTVGRYNDGAPVLVTRSEATGALVCDAWTYDIHDIGENGGQPHEFLTTRTYYGYTPSEAREMFRTYCVNHNLKITG